MLFYKQYKKTKFLVAICRLNFKASIYKYLIILCYSEDDTAELMAELNRIKRERAQEQKKIEEEKKAEDERVRMENAMSSNPLLNENSDFSVKRR